MRKSNTGQNVHENNRRKKIKGNTTEGMRTLQRKKDCSYYLLVIILWEKWAEMP